MNVEYFPPLGSFFMVCNKTRFNKPRFYGWLHFFSEPIKCIVIFQIFP